jgi:flagellar basal body-associated protein FliL
MKEKLLKYWKDALIGLLILFIAVSGIISNCTGKAIEKTFTQANVDSQLNKQGTDLKEKYLTANGETLNALQVAEKKISDGLKPRIIIKSAKAEKLVEKARKDTNTTALCDSALNAQETLIFDIGLKAHSDSLQLNLCERQSLIKDSLNTVFKNAYSGEMKINTDLNTALIKANKGKNTKWYFLGAGALLTFFIIK